MMTDEIAKPRGKIAFKLHITIILIFAILTLPVIVIFVAVTYRANEELITGHTERFVQKLQSDNQGNISRLLSPMINSVRTATTLMRDTPEYFVSESSADYLQEIIVSNEGVYSAYVSFEDGAFRQVRRSIKGKTVLGQEPPVQSQYISRYMDGKLPSGTTVANDAYTFQAPWGIKVGEISGPSSYDPRSVSYYQSALNLKATNISDPYLFESSGELGVTIASPVISNVQPIGVIAIDLSLKSISQFLANNKSTPNTISIIADEAGNIIAHPEFELGLKNVGASLSPNRLDKLEDPRIAAALGERLRTRTDQFKFRAGKDSTEYLALFSPFPKEFKKSWEVLTITPTEDFIGDIRRTNRDIVLFSVIAFLIQIVLIYVMSRMIARPIEQLAREVMSIREFSFDNIRKINSRVSEISYLSDAIFMLERAIQSFTSYVPTVLVKQLLMSGQATKLGVESRYLTIFFTDLEGFSSLSESEPSQQLLARVSDYFSTVTHAVEREEGTVDKFIGDAVMAFWGAPKIITNHAYLACVAAVRAQRGMKILNAAWTAEKMPPLKLRIGIHSDSVLVGNVGSLERVSYTVMGDGVNVAARLEGINKEMGTWTCVSHNVFREAGELLWLRPIDTVAVKGRRGELLIYELLGIRSSDPEICASEDEIALCEMTRAAYAQYAAHDFELAINGYSSILDKYPDDPVAKRMFEKSREQYAKMLA